MRCTLRMWCSYRAHLKIAILRQMSMTVRVQPSCWQSLTKCVTDSPVYQRFGWIVVIAAKLSLWLFCILFISIYRLSFLLSGKKALLSNRSPGWLNVLSLGFLAFVVWLESTNFYLKLLRLFSMLAWFKFSSNVSLNFSNTLLYKSVGIGIPPLPWLPATMGRVL